MPAISDSSPLILFSRIGRLDTLQALYEEIVIPPAIWREVVTAGANRAGTSEVAEANWIHQQAVSMAVVPERFRGLDSGELEVILLATSWVTPIPVLLDDGPARRLAQKAGMFVIGSAGIVGRAKELGLVTAVRPMLAELQNAGLFLGPSAERTLLEQIGEL
jgi:predicted nucleic acid-binding protein